MSRVQLLKILINAIKRGEILRGFTSCPEFLNQTQLRVRLPAFIYQNNIPTLLSFKITANSSTNELARIRRIEYPRIGTYTVIISVYIEVYLCDPVKGSTAKRRERNFSEGMEQRSAFAAQDQGMRTTETLATTTQRRLRLFPQQSLLC